MTNEENSNRSFRQGGWGWKFIFIFPLIALAFLAIGYLVMILWNNIIPSLFPTLTIGRLTYLHALGLLVLCKILLGGHRRGGYRRAWRGRHDWYSGACSEKWMNMSEEDRIKLKEQWKMRCGAK